MWIELHLERGPEDNECVVCAEAKGKSNSDDTNISAVYHLLLNMKSKDCTLIAVYRVNNSRGTNIHPSRRSSVNLKHENVRNCNNVNLGWECCQCGCNMYSTQTYSPNVEETSGCRRHETWCQHRILLMGQRTSLIIKLPCVLYTFLKLLFLYELFTYIYFTLGACPPTETSNNIISSIAAGDHCVPNLDVATSSSISPTTLSTPPQPQPSPPQTVSWWGRTMGPLYLVTVPRPSISSCCPLQPYSHTGVSNKN